MNSICVFCGSSLGFHPIYKKTAIDLGRMIAEEKLTLVYGGGSIGLMGVLANTVMENGGKVIGVIPRFLYDKEVGLDSVTQLIIVESMHERKQKMAELSNAFIALPGGIGTMEELFEIFTWSQLALIKKPVAILNVNSFFDQIIHFIDKMVQEGFLRHETANSLIHSGNVMELILKIQAYNYAETPKWIGRT
ncbi:MAG: TIGR00730 family Rossman fold protein [Cyclobacteriaceae bacterium]|nr:TIGR00730 family Rossman fold protein [Cyclobacteriaceae bacterium]